MFAFAPLSSLLSLFGDSMRLRPSAERSNPAGIPDSALLFWLTLLAWVLARCCCGRGTPVGVGSECHPRIGMRNGIVFGDGFDVANRGLAWSCSI